MAAQVLSFFQRSPRYAPAPADWSQQELAEFYRVEAALIRAGIRVGTDRGLSDEKEPWFVFYRTDDGEVVIHFARIDGEYLIAGPAYEEIARGFDFTSMVRNMVARHPMIRRSDRGDNIALHPAALLVAVVGTAFFKTGEARAAETGAAGHPSHSRPALLSTTSNVASSVATPATIAAAAAQPSYDTVQLPANQAVLVLAAALLASDFALETANIGGGVQGSLAAATAALDFSGPSAPIQASSDGEAAFAVSHAAAQAGTPVQTVSSVLSLVALLSTLPHSVEITGAPEPLPVLDSVAPYSVASSELAPPAVHDSANWSLEVQLGDGALPNVEAVKLVRAIVGEAAAQKITVIEVSKLPDVLAEIISRGEHVQVQPVTAQPATGTTDPSTPPSLGETPSAPHGDDTVTTAPTPGQSQTPAPHGFVAANIVTQFIDYFLSHTDHVTIMMQGSNVVIYDSRVMTDPGSISHLSSVSFELYDHTSINLVGDHSALLHYDFTI